MDLLRSLRRCQNLSCPYDRNTWRVLMEGGRGLWFQNLWHCSEKCFLQALPDSVQHGLLGLGVSPPASHRIPLGVALISRGLVTEEQLKAAVQEKESRGGRLGAHLRSVAALDEGKITEALAAQWGCPVYFLSEKPGTLRLAGLIPAALSRLYGLVPVRFLRRKRVLHVAFDESLRREPLDAMEYLHRCRIEPGVADASAVEEAIQGFERQPRPFDKVFSREPDLDQVSGEVDAACRQIRASRVSLAPCGRHLWVRLVSRRYSANLVFGPSE